MAPSPNAITIEGLTEAIALIDSATKISDFRERKAAIQQILVADVDERFNSAPRVRAGGVVYGGVNWPALTDPYLKANPRREGGQVLRDTGELQQSFTGDGQIYNVGKNEIEFGTALPKARGLQRKRPMIFIHDELLEEVEATLLIALDE
ncbi:MAG: hypothetical protein AAF215_33590 [Cyanobacteria bacterium P01_A01_bin.123]